MTPPRDYLSRVRIVARGRADRPALGIVREDGLDLWTYGQVWGALCRGGARLAEAGVARGDRVGIIGETSPAWGVAELAVFHRGAVSVPLDSSHPDGVIRAILADAGARRVLCSPTQMNRMRTMLAGADVEALGFEEVFDIEEDAGEDTAPEPVPPDAPRLIVYTSGTTGDPKGVTLTDGNITSQLDGAIPTFGMKDDEVVLSILPLSHVYAQMVNLLAPLYIGASVRFAEEPTPQAVRRALQQGGVTAFGAVPQFFALFRDRVRDELRKKGRVARWLYGLLRAVSRTARRATGWSPGRLFFPEIHRSFGGRLRWVLSAGSHLDPGLAREFTDWGFRLRAGYGLTETTAGVSVTLPGDTEATTVGRPVPGAEVRLREPNAEGIGEVLVRGPVVMAGYWGRPEATAEVIDRDGWLHTGDLGRFDRKGNLIITGRAKEMIVLASGKNVFPEELDDHYSAHRLFREVCVVGLPEPGGGERLHAVIVPDLDAFRREGITHLDDWVRFEMEQLGLALPPYQRVRGYTIWREPLPRTPTRKVRRFEVLRALEETGARDSVVAPRGFEWTDEDRALAAGPVMRALVEAGRLGERVREEPHPDMNLEFDLEVDSLERAEMLAQIAARLATPLDVDEAAEALTLRELAAVVEAHGYDEASVASGPSWAELMSDPDARAEARRRLPRHGGAASLLLRCLRGLGRVAGAGYFGLRVQGTENLMRLPRPFLLCPNHVSFADATIVSLAVPWEVRRDVFYLGAAEMWQGTAGGIIAKLFQVVPVDTGKNVLRALQLGAAGLEMGKVLMIFPEGERSVNGRLRPFKPGTGLLVRHTGTPVVPTAIIGAYEAWGRDRSFPRPGRVTVAFGEPIDFRSGFTDDEDADVARINRELRERIAALVQDHGGPPPQPEAGDDATACANLAGP